MSAFSTLMTSGSLTMRAVRSAGFAVLAFGGGQALRLISNLILTRLLFPEAFGLMALVMVILQGLAMFSDVGVTPAILQSRRGDDQDFLNTAWTIQVGRGFLLWVAAAALAAPFAQFYGEPQLAELLPVMALTLIIAGFNPTRLDTANRHLQLGRVTALELTGQVIGVVAAVLLAWAMQSVWALVISNLFAALCVTLLYTFLLPGAWNRFRWEPAAASELINFGKWIFLSTVAGFFFTQGDKLLIGRYLPLDAFGVYNIGYFLASFPLILGRMVTNKVLIPIYRERPPGDSPHNFAKLRRMRTLVTGLLLALVMALGYAGVWLVELLYDPRYAMAGAVVVMIACMQVPQIVGLTYDQAAIAAGDSRRFFYFTAAKAALMVGSLVVGLELGGLPGALVAQGVAFLLAYPVLVWLARRMKAWDPLHDAAFLLIGAILAAGAIWVNFPAIAALGAAAAQ